MSAYSTMNTIQALLPDTVKVDAGIPTDVLAQSQTTNYELINARLALRYTMPADATTSPHFYAQCQAIESMLVAADVCDYAREADTDNADMHWYAEGLRNRAMQMLDWLATGIIVAADGTATDAAEATDGLTAADVDEDTDDLYSVFRRDQLARTGRWNTW